MAAEDDIVDETSQLSATDSSDDDDSTQDQIETLIAGRERRRTAGNRYDRDMVLEGAGDGEDPDEVALLFADNEQEDDDEFKSGDDDEDADMSSSDDDDQGPNAAADDMEGEKELQKQAKVERARKRKADLALTSVAGLRKKLKTDPTRPAAVTAAPAKPSKKKERVTWVHDPDSGRSSLRKQTIAHRAETIARLKKSEAQSKKMKALKEQRDRERAKDAPKELTQADRLAEAARVERQNAKSLNRWEALEKKRQEEQAAKLAALKNRRLEGPVVSWWSAKGTWVGPKLSKIGTKDAGEIFEVGTEPKKRGRKSKAFLEQQAAEKAAQSAVPPSTATASEPSATPQAKPDVPETAPVEGPSNTPAKADASMPMELDDPKQSREDPAKPDQSAEPDTTLPTEPSTDTPTLPLADHSKTSPPPNNDIETPREDVPPKQTSEQPPPDQETSFLNGIQEYADMHTENNASESRRESPTPKILEEHEKTAAQVPGPGDDDTEQSRPQREKQVPGETASSADTPSTEIKMLSQAPSLETEARPTPGAQDASVLHPTPNIPASGGAPVSTQIQSDPTQAHPQVDPQTSVVKVEEGSTEAPPATAEPPPPPRPPPEEPTVEYSTRNIVILESFDELSDDARRDYSLFFNKSVRKMEKRVKHVQELCPITTLPVKYRDPETGIGFANVIGYKKLQDLKQHRYIWSSMLGCYVGREGGQVARGVPEGFVDKT